MKHVTPELASIFRERGVVHLPGALGRDRVRPMREHVQRALDRLYQGRNRAASAALGRLPVFQQIGRLSEQVKDEGLLAGLATPDLLATMAALAGTRLVTGPRQFLISPPRQGAWSLTGPSWHTDIAPSERDRVPGIQLFALLDEVAPRGGATLAIAGSHDLPDGPRRALRAALRTEGDPEGVLRGLGLSIVEMSGRAGDAYLMDMRALHTPSVNTTSRFRMMATVRCLAEAAPRPTRCTPAP